MGSYDWLLPVDSHFIYFVFDMLMTAHALISFPQQAFKTLHAFNEACIVSNGRVIKKKKQKKPPLF